MDSKSKRKKSRKLFNTRNEKCSKNNYTSCCPHMKPKNDGSYAATNEKSVLKYKKKKYILFTCCMMCSDAMNKLAINDPYKFKKEYISRFLEDGTMIAKNKHSKKEVQKLKVLK
jgi:hypothetical protein